MTLPNNATVATIIQIGQMKNPAKWLHLIVNRMESFAIQPCFVRVGIVGDGKQPSFKIVFDDGQHEVSSNFSAYNYNGKQSFLQDANVNGRGWSSQRTSLGEVQQLLASFNQEC